MTQDEKPSVTIYSDGGCKPNPGKGGWGAVLMFGEHRKDLSGAEWDTTNNRMELTAAIEALDTLNQPCLVTMHTDSEYLKNGITRWLKGWVRNGWITSTRQPVKNEDLWQQLHEAIQRHEIRWKWVKGHDGNTWNEYVDQLATRARESLRR
jgi:ribonuclease HI